jgi:hypothetical protein
VSISVKNKLKSSLRLCRSLCDIVYDFLLYFFDIDIPFIWLILSAEFLSNIVLDLLHANNSVVKFCVEELGNGTLACVLIAHNNAELFSVSELVLEDFLVPHVHGFESEVLLEV